MIKPKVFPRKMWLKYPESDFVNEIEVIGETRISWIQGPEWVSNKWPKRKYSVVTEAEYQRWLWVSKHRYLISDQIRRNVSSELVERIAALIGYKEGGERKP